MKREVGGKVGHAEEDDERVSEGVSDHVRKLNLPLFRICNRFQIYVMDYKCQPRTM